jgi:hypothetical protein
MQPSGNITINARLSYGFLTSSTTAGSLLTWINAKGHPLNGQKAA